MSLRTFPASLRTPLGSSALWLLLGVVVALFLQWTQATALGGWSGLLAVGGDATVRPMIQAELPDLVTVEGWGHDGQIGYAIALDLDGSEVSALLVDAGYRYRRILLPFAASLGGLLDGPALLGGFMLVTALGMGAAAAALESIRRRFGWSPWIHLGVVANPGLWMSVRLLTADVLAFGLAAVAVASYVAGRRQRVVVLLILAVLAKDQYLLVALSLAGHAWFARRDRSGVAFMAIPGLVLAVWAACLQFAFGDGFTARGNLTWPGGWIPSSVEAWITVSAGDQVLVAVGVASLAWATVAFFTSRSRLFRWLVGPWILLAAVSSEWVWALGNNVVRVFAPLLTLGVVASIAPLRQISVAGRRATASSRSG